MVLAIVMCESRAKAVRTLLAVSKMAAGNSCGVASLEPMSPSETLVRTDVLGQHAQGF